MERKRWRARSFGKENARIFLKRASSQGLLLETEKPVSGKKNA
jgi:hypothetical protein